MIGIAFGIEFGSFPELLIEATGTAAYAQRRNRFEPLTADYADSRRLKNLKQETAQSLLAIGLAIAKTCRSKLWLDELRNSGSCFPFSSAFSFSFPFFLIYSFLFNLRKSA